MDENPEVAVDTTTDETVLEPTGNTEEVDALNVRLAEAEEAKRQLTARAHKAEAELKQRKAEAPQLVVNTGLDSDAVDVKILQSQGMSEDLIKELKALAKVRGTSILATQIDPIFLVIKGKAEADEKAKSASLGASRGSGSPKTKLGFETPNLSDADHKELWRKGQGL